MGRKKKNTQKTVVTSTQQIGYQGSINLNIANGKRTLLTKKYHNSGRYKLFKFLANCLAGNFAEPLRPVKVRLYYLPNATLDEHDPEFIAADEFNFETQNNKLIAASPFIVYDATPVIDETNENNVKITLHYSIPFAYISKEKIHIIALYSSNSSGTNEASAYYVLKDNDGWDPLDLTDIVGDYSIIFNWELAISNK